MTDDQKTDIKALIAFYESRGWDWGNAAAYRLALHNNRIVTHCVCCKVGRRKKEGKERTS